MSHNELSELYKTDPEGFEVRTREMLEELFTSLPPERQQRARCFQWTIDQTLSHYKDPIARMNKMVELFWAGVQEFKQVHENPQPKSQKAAVVLPFQKA